MNLFPDTSNASLNTAIANESILEWQPGDYYIDDTITVRNKWGLQFRGSGYPILHWVGPPDRPMILLENVRDSVFASFQIEADNPLLAGIQSIRNNQGITVTPRYNSFHNISMGCVGGQLGDGFLFGGGDDANNDFELLIQCSVNNYSDTGYKIANSQVYGVRLIQCEALGNGIGQYGCLTTGAGGYFTWEGGGTNANTVADFGLGRQGPQPFVIDGAVCEGSAKFLSAASWSGASSTVTVKNCRFAANGSDDTIIVFKRAGLLRLENCQMGDGTIGNIRPLAIEYNVLDAAKRPWSFFIFTGNTFYTNLSNPFTGLSPTTAYGNARMTGDGIGEPL
jgi:hypothetical protein